MTCNLNTKEHLVSEMKVVHAPVMSYIQKLLTSPQFHIAFTCQKGRQTIDR